MRYYFAPMEGVTGAVYRRTHREYFPGVDKYFMPFITPTTNERLTPRQKRDVASEANAGVPAVPQLLTRTAADFIWAANALFDMGYSEVNLNLGCPSGTVTAKGKGAGMLARPEELDCFLDTVFSQAPPMKISLKTRLGLEDPEEFPRLLEIFAKYPVSLLILHPRVRADFYKRPVRMEWFRYAADHYNGPLCFNGGLVTAGDCARFAQDFPGVDQVMIGQGLLANPALVRQARGGPGPDKETLRAFHDELYHTYLECFASQRNTVFHMKELWSYLSRLFVGAEGKPLKRIRKAADSPAYEAAVDQMFSLPLREEAEWGTGAPL